MADDLMRPFRDAMAMVDSQARDDKAAWVSLWSPYLQAFEDGDGNPMAKLVGALGAITGEAIKRYAESANLPLDAVMREWLLWAAAHDPDDPSIGPAGP